ncbi:MAG: (Fe-S)-binding protein [Armatimonadia bacterium]
MKIALFVPCYVDQFFPQVAEATLRILSHLGHEVVVPPDQTCCGQPTFNAGYWPESRRIARNFLRVFADHDLIVAPSGSCVSMVRVNYPQLFAGEPEERLSYEIGPRVRELTSFLVDDLGITNLGAKLSTKVTVHDSCHPLRELGVREQPRALLRAVEGLELVEMEKSDVCCGFGGVFSAKYPEVSTAMADEKLDNALRTGAEWIVGVEASCLMHLQGRIDRRGLAIGTRHVAELLARGMGLL